MTLWDGLTSTHSTGHAQRIMVLGATNRIHDIDEAILRRMPKRFPVPLPGTIQRRSLLQLILRDTKLDHALFDFDYMASITASMSGSDIKEACRDAAMAPLREYMREHRGNPQAIQAVDPSQLRGLRNSDFLTSTTSATLMQRQQGTATDDDMADVFAQSIKQMMNVKGADPFAGPAENRSLDPDDMLTSRVGRLTPPPPPPSK